MFKKTLFSIAALTVLTGSALAADLPSYKAPPPPPPPPPPLWTGFYVGLNAGGTWSQSNSVYTSSFPVAGVGDNPANTATSAYLASSMALGASGIVSTGNNGGFIGGGQIGYNWQFYNSFVAGVEADIQGIASSRSNAAVANVLSLADRYFPPRVPDLLGRPFPATSSSITLARCAAALATWSRRPYSCTARAVSLMAAFRSGPQSSRGIPTAPTSVLRVLLLRRSVGAAFLIRASAGRPAPASSGCSCRIGAPRSSICTMISAT